MYVVMNVLRVPEEGKANMAEMFSHAAENMKKVKGCLDFQFLDATGEQKQIVYTKWANEDAFRAWRESDAFSKAHASERTESSPAMGSAVETYNVLHSF